VRLRCLFNIVSVPPSHHQTNSAYDHWAAVHTLTMTYVYTHTCGRLVRNRTIFDDVFAFISSIYCIHIYILYSIFPRITFPSAIPPPSNITLAKHRHKYHQSCFPAVSDLAVCLRRKPPDAPVVTLRTGRRIRFNT